MAFISPLPTVSTTTTIVRPLSSFPRLNQVHRRRPLSSRPPPVHMRQNSEQETSVPLSSLNNTPPPPTHAVAPSAVEPAKESQEDTRTEAEKEADRLRAAEKFITINEGKFECASCGYVYEPLKGEPRAKIPPGTDFELLPESFVCVVCRSPKSRFFSVNKVIAGFADNQKYGFGSNTMTSGQKSLFIYGGLLFFFFLLLSGYALN